jgi:hypothetical protein
VGSLTLSLKGEGDELARRGEYEKAVVKYLAAMHSAPQDVAIRFALAVALSHLDRRAETVEHFRFVVVRGTPGSPEVKIARDWLAAAGELEGAARREAETVPTPTGSRVSGRIKWGDIEPRGQMVWIAVTLTGDDVANRQVSFTRSNFKIGLTYDFRGVPPGNYRLTADVGGARMWEQRVTVTEGKETVFDLTEANAAVPRDFVPRNEG